MALTEEQYQARIAYLKSRQAVINFAPDVYEKALYLVTQMVKNFNDIDPLIYDLEEGRVAELQKSLSAGKSPMLSSLDLFDIEKISFLAENDPDSFSGGEKFLYSKDDIVALTRCIEEMQAKIFPVEKKQASNNG